MAIHYTRDQLLLAVRIHMEGLKRALDQNSLDGVHSRLVPLADLAAEFKRHLRREVKHIKDEVESRQRTLFFPSDTTGDQR